MTTRRLLALGLLALVAALAVPAATASSGIRSWGYHQLVDGGWQPVTDGPADTLPADGSVEGWRFAVRQADPRVPRAVLTFEDICSGTLPQEGHKRVGVVTDYGRDVDAPPGQSPPDPQASCIVIEESATSLEVISVAHAQVRHQGGDGLVCAVEAYPASGCGDSVAEVSQDQAAEDEPVEIALVAMGVVGEDDSAGPTQEIGGNGMPLWVWLVLALLAVGGLLTVLLLGTRRRDAEEQGRDAGHPEDQAHPRV